MLEQFTFHFLKQRRHTQGSQTRGPLEGPMRSANIRKNEDFSLYCRHFAYYLMHNDIYKEIQSFIFHSFNDAHEILF